MSQSKRFQIVKQGGPTEVVSVAKPTIENDNEVIVKMKAVALQPVDWKRMDWGLMVQEWPLVTGLEGAGEIEEVGKAVDRFKPGDRVFGSFAGGPRSASYQEYAAVKEGQLAKIPDGVAYEDAAQLSIGTYTALAGLYCNLKVPVSFMPEVPPVPYKSVLVLGGSSSVGGSFIQLWKHFVPNTTILTTCSTKHNAHVSKLGATKAFDRTATAEEIRGATPNGKGVDVIFDAVNGVATDTSLLSTLDPSGSKMFSEVMTGANLEKEKVPQDVDHDIASGINALQYPGVIQGISDLVKDGYFVNSIPSKVVGEGLESLEKGISELRGGVSGTKLVVRI